MPRKYKKRTTIQKARKRFNKYYQDNEKGKEFDALYQKKPTRTLQCNLTDEAIDITTENYDGTMHTSRNVQPGECEDGSIKYITTKHGPRTFDIVGIDWFEEDDYIDFIEKNSKGYPKTNEDEQYNNKFRNQHQDTRNKSYLRRKDDENEEIYDDEDEDNKSTYYSPVKLYWKKYNAIKEKLSRNQDLTEKERKWIDRNFAFVDDSDEDEDQDEEVDENDVYDEDEF